MKIKTNRFFYKIMKLLLFRYKARIAGLSRQTGFYRTDLWKHDLQKYDNIVIFGVEQMVSKP